MRKLQIFASLLVISLTLGLPVSQSAELPTTGITQKVPSPGKDQYVVSFNQTVDGWGAQRYSHRVVQPDASDPASPLPHYQAVLPACRQPKDVTCIESVESKKINDAVWTKATLSTNQLDVTKLPKHKYYEYTTWPAEVISSSISPQKALPAGGVASSWDLSNSPHSLGISYLVEVSFLDSLVGLGDGPRFLTSIEPWNWNCLATNFCDYLGSSLGSNGMSFPNNTEFRITIRTNFLSQRIGKWATGRLEKPTVSLQNEKLIISGSPVSYPMGYSLINSKSECSTALGEVWKKYSPLAGNLCDGGSGYMTDSTDVSSLPIFDALSDNVIENGKMQRWSFSTVPIKSFSNNCLSSKDFSLASSNAMLYSNQPPVWNKSEGTLSYRIASTHLDSLGNINRGNYSLALPKSVADCLWNFDVSKGSAVISITNSTGNQNIAVSALRTTTDWIYFDASGFTFSSPEIKVKFVSANSLVKKPESQNEVQASVTCIKGKVVKVVKGKNSKCPQGYEKKIAKPRLF